MSEYLEAMIDKFVFRVATDCLFSPEGVWVRPNGNQLRIGLTDFVQQRGGDVAFAHVKPVGSQLVAGDEIAEIETVKANVSLFSPVGGTVIEINSALETSPEIINEAPYEKGWLAVLEAGDWASDRAKLLTPEAYLSVMRSQAEKELNGQ